MRDGVWLRRRPKPEWSGRQDLNLRPPVPQTDALPGCATPRPVPRKTPRQGGFSANGSDAASRLARARPGADTGAMMKVASEQSVVMGKRVLVFSSIGHALMHM